MIVPSARHSLTKFSLFYRAEVGQFHPEPEPFGWRIYTGTDKNPISHLAAGLQSRVTPGTQRSSNARDLSAWRVTRFLPLMVR